MKRRVISLRILLLSGLVLSPNVLASRSADLTLMQREIRAISRESAGYFRLFPQLQNLREAHLESTGGDSVSLVVSCGDSVLRRRIVIPLSQADAGALEYYVRKYETIVDCANGDSGIDRYRMSFARLTERGIISNNPQPHSAAQISVVAHDSTKTSGTLAYADEEAVYI